MHRDQAKPFKPWHHDSSFEPASGAWPWCYWKKILYEHSQISKYMKGELHLDAYTWKFCIFMKFLVYSILLKHINSSKLSHSWFIGLDMHLNNNISFYLIYFNTKHDVLAGKNMYNLSALNCGLIRSFPQKYGSRTRFPRPGADIWSVQFACPFASVFSSPIDAVLLLHVAFD